MTRRIAILASALLLLAGCGGETAPTTDTTPTTTGSSGTQTGETTATMSLRVFFYRDAALVPVEVEVPRTEAVATAAIERLLEGPPPGYETAIPDDVELSGIEVGDGVATATFSSSLGGPPRTAQAQIVATLAQFPTVTAARIAVEGAGPALLTDGAGRRLESATPDDYVDLTEDAPIFVSTPKRGATVTSPVVVSGTADVFEATFLIDVWSGDRKLRTEVVTATSGSGQRGTWRTTLELPPGPARLVFYEESAEDGSRRSQTEVPITVE